MAEINNSQQNDISIPWYRATVNKVPSNRVPINNVKIDIHLPKPEPKPKPQTEEQPQEQEQRETEDSKARETETQDNRGKVPTPEIPPIPAGKKKPEEEPAGQPAGIPVTAAEQDSVEVAKALGKAYWNSLNTEQKADLLYNLAHGMKPKANEDRLWKGVKFAVSYDYTNFNLGNYYNGLVLECGVVLAIIILIIAAILIPGVPPF